MLEIKKSLVVHADGFVRATGCGHKATVDKYGTSVLWDIQLKPGYKWQEIEYLHPATYGQQRTEKGFIEQAVLDFRVYGGDNIEQCINLSQSCKLVFLHYFEPDKAYLQGIEIVDGIVVTTRGRDTRLFVSEVHVPEHDLEEEHEQSYAWVTIKGTALSFSRLLVAPIEKMLKEKTYA